MKINYVASLLAGIAFLFAVNSCTEKEKVVPRQSCKIVSVYDSLGNLVSSAEFLDDQLKKLTRYKNGQQTGVTTYTYFPSRILTSTDSAGVIIRSSVLELASVGVAYKEYIIEKFGNDSVYDTIQYLYQMNGFMTRKFHKYGPRGGQPGYTDSTIYTNYQGNITNIAHYHKGKKEESKVEYHTDKFNYSAVDIHGMPSYGVGYYGYLSQNLVKTITRDGVVVRNWNYDINKDLYITKITDGESGKEVYRYEYSCN